jgi:hypothetical protein
MEPPSSPAPVAVRVGPFVPDPGPDPREVMALIERRVREIRAEGPGSSNGPMTLRGHALTRALRDVPMSSGIRRIEH